MFTSINLSQLLRIFEGLVGDSCISSPTLAPTAIYDDLFLFNIRPISECDFLPNCKIDMTITLYMNIIDLVIVDKMQNIN